MTPEDRTTFLVGLGFVCTAAESWCNLLDGFKYDARVVDDMRSRIRRFEELAKRMMPENGKG